MKNIFSIPVQKHSSQGIEHKEDQLAIEEPLEIRLNYGPLENRQQKSVSITMRTPGNDAELATGFLFTEGIIQHIKQIKSIEHLKSFNPQEEGNIILVHLDASANLNLNKLERHFYTSSSCGVCGKASIDAVRTTSEYPIQKDELKFKASIIHQLPAKLRAKQQVFDHTGGLHAAALFDTQGSLLFLREDVGRHNAVDKLIGTALSHNKIPLTNHLILVSGRASFELVQKTLMAGIPMLTAIGAPSSLAVQLAKESGMSILGFVRDERFNVYCGADRIQ